jgi:hypothetical protein
MQDGVRFKTPPDAGRLPGEPTPQEIEQRLALLRAGMPARRLRRKATAAAPQAPAPIASKAPAWIRSGGY